jgi:hypothetical protein
MPRTATGILPAVLFLGAAFLLSANLFASSGQAAVPPERPRFGLEGGLNRSTISMGDLPANSRSQPRTGWAAGLTLTVPQSRLFSVDTGVFYSAKGGKVRTTYGGYTGVGDPAPTSVETEIRRDYVAVPLLVRMTLPFDAVRPYARLGLEGSVLVSSSAERTIKYGDLDPGRTRRTTDHTRSLDLGATAAAGAEVGLAEGTRLFFEGGYTMGILTPGECCAMEFRSVGFGYDPSSAGMRNRVLAFRGGVRLQVGGGDGGSQGR